MDDSPPVWFKLNVPGSRLLLCRFDIEAETYALYVTDLTQIWVEALTYQQILQRADDCIVGGGLDPKRSMNEFYALLEKLSEHLAAPAPSATSKTGSATEKSTKMQNREMVLSVKIVEEIAASELSQTYSQSQSYTPTHETSINWTFKLTLMSKADPRYLVVFQTIMLGLIGVVDAQGQQISELMVLLRKKDFHLRHLREEYHDTTEPHIHREAARTFVPSTWQHDWKSRREEAALADATTLDVEEVLTRAFTDYATPLWGFHSAGRHWSGSLNDAVAGASPEQAAYKQSKRNKARDSLLPSSPPPLQLSQRNSYSQSQSQRSQPLITPEEESTQSEDEVPVKTEQESPAAIPAALPLPSLSPLKSPSKRKRGDGLIDLANLKSEPPSPSPKRQRQTTAFSSSLTAPSFSATTFPPIPKLDTSLPKDNNNTDTDGFVKPSSSQPLASTTSLEAATEPTATAQVLEKDKQTDTTTSTSTSTREKELKEQIAKKAAVARQRQKRRF